MKSVILLLSFVSLAINAKQPNIIIVLTDDQGYADLGAHGVVKDIHTPHLDKLAQNGAMMTNGYVTAPQCIPSRAGIVTGRYQTRFGLDGNLDAPMDLAEITIAERLQKAGYKTGFVGKWHLEPNQNSLRWMEREWTEGLKKKQRSVPYRLREPYLPQSRGFSDYYDGTMHSYFRNYDLSGKTIPHEHEIDKQTFRVDKQTDAALAFIKKNHDNPFFLHLSYYAPHTPIEYVEEHFTRFPGKMAERRRWALASVAAIDDGVGAIMKSLRTYDLEEKTLIFFLSDNGAPLKMTMEDSPFDSDHGGWDGSLNTPMIGEKGMLSEAGIHVPFLAYWRGTIAPQVFPKPVLSLDIGATALALAGIQTEPNEIDGVNLMPFLKGDNLTAPHDALYWRFWGQSAIREGRWKLLSLENGHRMLFDLNTTEQENLNLITEYPELADRLQKKLDAWLKQQKRPDMPTKYGREHPWYRHYFNVHL